MPSMVCIIVCIRQANDGSVVALTGGISAMGGWVNSNAGGVCMYVGRHAIVVRI